ncbi:hypothetical protein GCM10029964_025320 [Kibdelosporangium lantanae]
MTGDYSAFWDERNYLNDVNKVRAAVLEVHGLNDWNVKDTHFAQWYDAIKKVGVPHKLWLHQAGHADPLGLRRDEWLVAVNRWFTRFLYKVPNGVEREPHLTIQREDKTWHDEAEWPVPGSSPASLYLGAGGNARGTLGPVPSHGSVVESLTDDSSITAESLADAASSPHRLSYTTGVTKAPLRLSGGASVDLRVSFSRPAANVTVLLVDRGPDGKSKIVSRGWTDPQNRISPWFTTPVTPGREYPVHVDLVPKDYVFAAGHTIEFVLLSSDHDYTLRPQPGAGISSTSPAPTCGFRSSEGTGRCARRSRNTGSPYAVLSPTSAEDRIVGGGSGTHHDAAGRPGGRYAARRGDHLGHGQPAGRPQVQRGRGRRGQGPTGGHGVRAGGRHRRHHVGGGSGPSRLRRSGPHVPTRRPGRSGPRGPTSGPGPQHRSRLRPGGRDAHGGRLPRGLGRRRPRLRLGRHAAGPTHRGPNPGRVLPRPRLHPHPRMEHVVTNSLRTTRPDQIGLAHARNCTSVLLTSDGVHKAVAPQTIEAVLAEAGTSTLARVSILVDTATVLSGTDNATACLVTLPAAQPEPETIPLGPTTKLTPTTTAKPALRTTTAEPASGTIAEPAPGALAEPAPGALAEPAPGATHGTRSDLVLGATTPEPDTQAA